MTRAIVNFSRSTRRASCLIVVFYLIGKSTGRCILQSSSSGTNVSLSHLQDLLGQGQTIGPYFFKSIQAAQFAAAAFQGDTNGLSADKFTWVPLDGGSEILATWSSNASAVVLAFKGANETLSNATANNSLQTPAFLNMSFGDNGTVDADATDPLRGLLGQQSLSAVISNVSGGAWPARIVATGFAEGGPLAKLAAVWAGAAYPGTHIRCILFGSPRLGDDRFDWAYQQLVDLRYEWAVRSDDRPKYPSDSPVSDALQYLGESGLAGNASAGPPGSLSYYMAALERNALRTTSQGSIAGDNAANTISSGNSTQPGTPVVASPPSPAPSGFLGRLKQSFNNLKNGISDTLTAAQGEFSRGEDNQLKTFPFHNVSADNPLACPALLCKIRPGADASCNVYHNGSDTIAPGSITITEPKKGTVVAVAWLEANSTAIYSFRGSVSRQDWLADFQQWLNDDPLSPVLNQLAPGTRVHSGFLGQFRAVTDQPDNDSYNIKTQLLRLSGGRPPTKVLCTGHSLGAGLASLCGIWAPLQWLDADVEVVTFGSPAVGNQQFADGFKLFVGRSYRTVDRLDVVPALPAFTGYVQLDYSMWIQDNGTIIAETRPHFDTKDLNWDDHACAAYRNATYNVTHISAPSWVTGLAPE